MGNITLSEAWAYVLAGASALVLLANAWKPIERIIQLVRAPNKSQDDRIHALEVWREEVDSKLDRDKNRLDDFDAGNRVVMQAQLALLGHALHGNNVKQMEDAEKGLQDYLVNK